MCFFLTTADVDEDANDDCILDTEAIEDNGEEDEKKPLKDEITKKVLDNALVQSYVYDKKHHLWAKLTFNVSSKDNDHYCE